MHLQLVVPVSWANAAVLLSTAGDEAVFLEMKNDNNKFCLEVQQPPTPITLMPSSHPHLHQPQSNLISTLTLTATLTPTPTPTLTPKPTSTPTQKIPKLTPTTY